MTNKVMSVAKTPVFVRHPSLLFFIFELYCRPFTVAKEVPEVTLFFIILEQKNRQGLLRPVCFKKNPMVHTSYGLFESWQARHVNSFTVFI